MKERSAHTTVVLSDSLLSSGVEGVHPLFDEEMIRRAFARVDGLLDEGGLWAAHEALRALSRREGLLAQRCYLRSLPASTVDVLVYLYFRHLDRRLLAAGPTLH